MAHHPRLPKLRDQQPREDRVEILREIVESWQDREVEQGRVADETCGRKTYEKGLVQPLHIEGKRRRDFTKRLGKHFLHYEINRLAR